MLRELNELLTVRKDKLVKVQDKLTDLEKLNRTIRQRETTTYEDFIYN